MYGHKGKSACELWAVINDDGETMYSRGGSSTQPKLMVYATEQKARAALRSKWIKQVMDVGAVKIGCIYCAPVR